MNNEITLEIVKNYKNIIEKIFDYSKDALLNFMHLGQLLKRVKEYKLYEIEEFQSVYDFALNKFGYKETSVKNFIAVFEKYADSEDLDYDYFDIKEEYKNYSFTSLVELLPVPEEETKVCFEALGKIIEFNIEQEIDINGEPYAVGIIEFRFCDCHDKIEIVDEKLIRLFQKFI